MEQIKNQHRSLSDIATDSIRDAIIRGDFKMGQAVTEAALSLSLNISKTPVREALSKLESEGLVVSEKNKGYRIFSLTKQEYIELSELRFALESQALRYGFERDRNGMIEKLENILKEMEGFLKVSDREIYQSLDTDFHHVFFESCGNASITNVYSKHQSVIMATRLRNLKKENITKHTSFEQHQALAGCLKDGDLDNAVKLLESHIVNYARESFVEPEMLLN
ncbi:MAG: GntR family transcriptional regulator [Gammaproteobacteria bacterium]|jgi:DNA-binding GntR family transcriptional regulator|nr:GntR family transcriptional regulator [Gammaproteobacteria bacterium]MBT5662533.1 GntR family transcriptional regulator [Alphaproteobacteria bacterium]MBT6634755.1 GntR family transcriptional regulator [Gammaproteobacteria bacterium]|tara:strand:- start:680 stop:1348 length:669 start_codon:yes stop_codon:yes gene_type:complete